MFATHCEFTGIGVYIYSQPRLTTVLLEHQADYHCHLLQQEQWEEMAPSYNTKESTQHYEHWDCKWKKIYIPRLSTCFWTWQSVSKTESGVFCSAEQLTLPRTRLLRCWQSYTGWDLSFFWIHTFIRLLLIQFLWNHCWNVKFPFLREVRDAIAIMRSSPFQSIQEDLLGRSLYL